MQVRCWKVPPAVPKWSTGIVKKTHVQLAMLGSGMGAAEEESDGVMLSRSLALAMTGRSLMSTAELVLALYAGRALLLAPRLLRSCDGLSRHARRGLF